MFFLLMTTTVFIVFTMIYLWFQFRYTYWKRKHTYYEKPKFPLGNFEGMGVTHSFNEILKKIYDSHKHEKAVGIYLLTKESLLIRDLDIARNIMIKDFNSFMNRGFIQSEKYDPLSGSLAFQEGNKWKHLRAKLSSAFTSFKVKTMFPIFLKCGDDLEDYLAKAAENDGIVDIMETTSKYTMDLIASCAFGIEIRCFLNPNSKFRNLGDFLFNPDSFQLLLLTFAAVAPKLAAFLHVRTIPKKISSFFMGVVKDTVEYREKNNVQRNDILQILIDLKNKGKIGSADGTKDTLGYDPTFTITEAAAQAFGFFFGGYESSARTLMFCLYELALQPDIKDKLRQEIDRVIAKSEGKITYDGIQEMTYLDQVVSEALRKHPPVPYVLRTCSKPYYIPEIDLTIEKDTAVFVSILGIHHDPDYYPNPEKFDPDRFSPENKERRESMTYMPFGDGPRACIGLRFGLMQTKTALSIILSKFDFAMSEKTKTPLIMNPKSIFVDVEGGIHLKIWKRF